MFSCDRGGCGKGDCGGKGCCDDPCDGKHGGKDGGKNGDKGKASDDKDAPMPPAPVVDPSAFLNTRKIIPASRIVR
jgi:hypothetical protein